MQDNDDASDNRKSVRVKPASYALWQEACKAWDMPMSNFVTFVVNDFLRSRNFGVAGGTIMAAAAAPQEKPPTAKEQKETAKQKEEKRIRYTCSDSFSAAIRDEYDNYPDDELDILYQDARDWRRTGEADGYAYGLKQKGFTAQEFITFHDLRTMSKEKGIW